MTEEITAKSQFDLDTMLPAYRWHGRRSVARRWLLVTVLVLGVCLAGLGLLSEREWQTDEVGATVIMLSAVGYLGWSNTWGRRRRIARSLKKVPGHGETIHWSFQDGGVGLQIGGTRAFVDWAHVYESVSTPDGALVYPQKNIFYWLPKKAFTSDQDYQRVLELLIAKTKNSTVG